MDLNAQARAARGHFDRGQFEQAVALYRSLCAEAHVVDAAYDEWLRGLAQALGRLRRDREAAFVLVYLGQLDRAMDLLAADDLCSAQVLQQQGRFEEAAARYLEQGHPVLAAIAFEQGKHDAEARSAWEQACRDPRLQGAAYEQALVRFDLGQCCLRLSDEEGHGHLVTAQRLLEEVADSFETGGLRERAFDCYQILLELGRRSGAFENLAEGYINCIRILKEDNLKYYVLQYYEDFLREALGRQEYHAAASLYREAAEYCLRANLIYDRHYLQAAANTWLLAAEKNQREEGPPEMSENAYLASVDCLNSLEDYARVGEVYQRLALLDLSESKRKRFGAIAERYRGAPGGGGQAPPFPEYLRQAHAYPEIWYMDLVEWEHDGDVTGVCLSVMVDRNYPDVVRRRALQVLLDQADVGRSGDPGVLARVAEGLGDLQVYVVLRPRERLFQADDVRVRRGVMRALRCLFFKRTFGLLGAGLRESDETIRSAALEALGRLHFNHAFDPLVRIYRELEEPRVKAIALESIGRIPSLEAGDFLIEVLRYEGEALRALAKRLLIEFDNRDIIPILRQHYHMESGPRRADLEEVLRQAGGLGG